MRMGIRILAIQKATQEKRKDFFATEYLNHGLKERSIKGGVVTIIVQGINFLLKMISTVVLARILTPADFGLIAMVTTITAFAMMFGELGLSAATVQKSEINHDQVSTLFWINVGFGVLITAAIICLAPAVAWFFGDSRLTPVTMALGTTFMFGGLAVQHKAMLRRHMRFFSIGVVGIISMAVSVAAAIVAGVLGAGYWSLVIMEVVMGAMAAIGIWIAFPWLPGRPRRNVGMRKILGFGGNITGFNIVNYFSRNADNILIGKFLGSTVLGVYSKAYALLMLPISQIRNPLNFVGIPALSRLHAEPKRYKKYYLKMLQLLAFITVPMAVLMGAYSHQIIRLVLGPQWAEAAEIFSILSFTALIQPLASTYGMVMISSDQAHRFFKLGLLTSIAYVISFVAGLPWGASGVALSYTIANYILLVPTLIYAFNSTPVRVRDFFKPIVLPCIAALAMVLASRIIFSFCTGFPDWSALIISLLSGGFVYLSVYLILPGGRSVLQDISSSGQLVLGKYK